MSIEMYQAAAQAQLQTPAWLIEANQVLALSSTELQSLVQKELEENPALELDERTICPACGRAFQGSCCPHCLSLVPSSLPQAESTLGLDDTSSWLSDTERGGFEDEEFDPTLLLASRMSLGDQLRLALRTQLPEADIMLIDYLVGNLDEDGYLHTTVQDAAEICEVRYKGIRLKKIKYLIIIKFIM